MIASRRSFQFLSSSSSSASIRLSVPRRSMWAPRLAGGVGRVAGRVVLGAGGTTAATAAIYADRLRDWVDDKRNQLADLLLSIDLSPADYPLTRRILDSLDLPAARKVHASKEVSDTDDSSSSSTSSSSSPLSSQMRDDQFMTLTREMIEVRNILKSVDKDLMTMPAIVVVGGQSSGKSSLLEAIIGHGVLPKGNNMVTKRPVEITLVNTPNSQDEYAEFPRQGLVKISDFERVRAIIEELNNAVPDTVCVSDDPIDLRIYSPNVPDLTFIDLPGYIAVNNVNQPPMLKEKIVQLCRKYIQEPNIILAVCAADVDLANSEALSESRKVDPYGRRTIGALTKIDLVDAQRAPELLKNDSYSLQLGYFGVICRGPKPLDDLKDVEKYRRISSHELEYFRKNAEAFEKYASNLGIPALRTALMKVLEEHLSKSLSHVVNVVRSELDETRYQFKVQFNDHVITPEAYTTEVLDKVKAEFRKLSSNYNRPMLRVKLQSILDARVIDICSDFYWASEDVSAMAGGDDDKLSKALLMRAQAHLTRSGIGRVCTQEIINVLNEALDDIFSQEPISFHENARAKLQELAGEMLRAKMYPTVDQVENALKPFKYDIDFTEQEWDGALNHAMACINAELKKSEMALEHIKNEVGRKKLRNAMHYLSTPGAEVDVKGTTSTEQQQTSQFPHRILTKAQEAQFLQARIHTLQQRIQYLRPFSVFSQWYPQCTSNKAHTLGDSCLSKCPEPYLFLLAEKLAQNAVMFIWIELLNDFFYQYPREVDNRLYYQLDRAKLDEFADENTTIRAHLKLQQKKFALENAMDKLMSVFLSRRG